MPPLDYTQLGVAAIVCMLMGWGISKLISGDVVPRKVMDELVGILKDRIAQEVSDKETLAKQNDVLAQALQASNAQLAASQQLIQSLIQED